MACGPNRVLLVYQERVKVGVDTRGQDIVGWVNRTTFRAEVLESGGGEQRPGRKNVSLSRYKFRVPYRRNIRSTGRLAYGDRIFEIDNVADPSLCRHHLIIDAMEMR